MHCILRVSFSLPPTALKSSVIETTNSLYLIYTSRGLLPSPNSGEQRRNELQYLSAQEGVLEPISVYRTYDRTNALTRLLWYKIRLRTVSLRAEPSDVRTRVQLVLEESVPNHSFRAPPLGRLYSMLLPLGARTRTLLSDTITTNGTATVCGT